MDEKVSCQASEVNALNFKALYDDTQSDVSINRKSLFRHQDAWETLRLRNAQFAASFDHAILSNLAISGQSGDTAAQQTTSPIRTGTGDTLAASAYPANRAVDTATAGIAAGVTESVQTNITTQVSALTAQMGALTTMVNDLAGSVTTNLQAVADSNASVAASLAAMAAALTNLAPPAPPAPPAKA